MLCAVLVALPLLVHGPSCGHDFDFHLQSWFAVSAAWHQGGPVWPHWVAAANYGAGEPRLVFYPPLSWILGATLASALPWQAVPAALTFLALAAAGLAFRRLAREWVSAPIAAGAACVYLANPYLLFVAYERTAYGELLGAIFVPLVVLYALRPRPAIVPLSLTVAALWLANAPAAVMGCYLLGFCASAAAVAGRSLVPLLRSLAGLALGVGLAGVYVLPAWYEQRWVEIARANGEGMRVEDSFLFEHTGAAFHDQVLHTASSIAVVVLATGLAAAALALLARRAQVRVKMREAGAGDVASLILSTPGAGMLLILFLLLPASDLLWRTAPELRFLQFPWRWLLVGGMAAAVALALLAQGIGGLRGSLARRSGHARGVLRYELVAGIALVLASGGAGSYAEHHYAQFCDEEDNVAAQRALLRADAPRPGAPIRGATGPGFEGTDEYTPKGDDNGEVQQGLPPVRLLASPDGDEGDDTATPNPPWKPAAGLPDTAAIDQWSPERIRLSIRTATAGYAVLRLMDYPAWQVTENDHPATARPHREDGLLTLPVEPGLTTIDVRYRATPDVLAGRGVSLASLGVLAGMLVEWRRRRAEVPGKA